MSALCRSDACIGEILAEKQALLNCRLEETTAKKLDFKDVQLCEDAGEANASMLGNSSVRTVSLGFEQLTEAHIINQHLVRTIAAMECKLLLEAGYGKIKAVMLGNQEKTIGRLQMVISEAIESHKSIREHIERLELGSCLK